MEQLDLDMRNPFLDTSSVITRQRRDYIMELVSRGCRIYPRIRDPYFLNKVIEYTRSWGTVIDEHGVLRVYKKEVQLSDLDPLFVHSYREDWES